MKKFILPFIIALSALAVSASSGLYSIIGLSKLFAGASTAVIVMASALELAKLVTASFLYQYWEKVNKLLKIYLIIATVVLISITSAGVYGFLSAAYQKTASQESVITNQIKALETKKQRYLDTKEGYVKDKTQTSKSTSELRQALSTGSITQYKDKQTGQILNTANTGNRKAFESQLASTAKEEEKISNKIDILNDSIFSLESQILDIQSKATTSGELGPLKYLSNLLDKPMDKIINWFILVIILVFDPLAISLVIAANFAFAQLKSPSKLAVYNEKPVETRAPDIVEPNPLPLDPNNAPAMAPPVPPPPANTFYSFMQPIFKRNKNSDVKTY